MDHSEPDHLNRRMPPVTEDNSSRHVPLPACVHSWFASVISIFFIGLAAGAVGGVLLGGTAVAVLQSLELLADNKLLMDQFEKFYSFMINYHGLQLFLFTEVFGVVSSTFSVVVGIYIGLSTYALVIKKKGEAAAGKALTVAGTVCLMGATLTGYILGLTLDRFLSITLNNMIIFYFIVVVGYVCPIITDGWYTSHSSNSSWWETNVFSLYILCITFKHHTFVGAVLTLIFLAVKAHDRSHSLKLTTATVPLMLTISDIYNVSGWQIVSLQSPTSTNTSSAVIEAIFVGVLTSQLLTVTFGMSLFLSWQRGGAAKICASAAASGGAALTAVKFGLPVLGPGPTIGALMGVAGAVGVSLSAAGEATDQYGKEKGHYGLVGRLGVTLGAAFGAFLYSCSHSGLSAVFMGLCAATIPAEIFLKPPFLHSTLWSSFVGLWMCIYTAVATILFTQTSRVFHVVIIFFLANAYMGFYLQFLPE